MSDAGYFPRGSSVLRMVHEEKVVGLLFGQRALSIGAIEPLNFVGTRRHTTHPDQPFKRLVATAKMFEAIFFGDRAQADRVLAAVHGMHSRVKGELPEDAGSYKAGTPYSAFDPEAMLWTVAVMADSARVFYELFVRRLSDAERDALWADYVRFAELFGMPPAVAPQSYREFQAWYDRKLASPRAHLTEEAAVTGRAVLLDIPVPRSRRLASRAHNVIQIAMLPPRVRELYGIEYRPAMRPVFHALVATRRLARPLTPARYLRGSCRAEFELVARSERALHAAGRPIPGALAPNPN
jgi:uncharacterized protein (DUF2236 family)